MSIAPVFFEGANYPARLFVGALEGLQHANEFHSRKANVVVASLSRKGQTLKSSV